MSTLVSIQPTCSVSTLVKRLSCATSAAASRRLSCAPGACSRSGRSNPDDAPKTGPPHLTILHHTDCGIKQLAAFPEQLAEFFEIPVADLDTKKINDPRAAVRIDVEIARRTLPGRVISGLVYDTETGLIEVVVPPSPA